MTGRTRRVNRGKGHSYELDGAKVDGVTTILGNGVPKPALVGWAAKTIAEFVGERVDVDPDAGTVTADRLVDALRAAGAKNRYSRWPDSGAFSRLALIETLKGVHWDDRDAAARRGTEVHALAERLVAGHEVDVPAELAGHVDSYIKFLDAWQVQPVLLETPVFNRTDRWAGTLDLIADLGDGLRWLLDIKSSRSGIFPETALQLSAYRAAEFYLDDQGDEQPMLKVDRCAAIWVRADGFDVIPVDAGPATYRTFRFVQRVAQWQTVTGADTVGEALTPPIRQETTP